MTASTATMTAVERDATLGTEPAWLSDLNPQQRQAVDHGSGPLLIVAGAGTGKTRTLAARVARLVGDGQVPERILLLTFTRRAARELVQRARTLSGNDDARRIWGGTFHSVAVRILRQHGDAVGIRGGFTVLDESDAADLIGLVRDDLGLGEKGRRFPRKETIAAIVSRVANALEPLSVTLAEQFPWCVADADDLRRVLKGYRDRKRANNVVDFDDLLLLWRALLDHPTVGPQLRGQFDHVLVDEYQDVNTVQADLVQRTVAVTGSLTAVGDDAQAIYSFRGASARHILDFADRYPSATITVLDRNYRSTPEILHVANGVADDLEEAHRKTLRTTRPSGVRPRLVTCRDEVAQSVHVCEVILDARERGIDLRDQAVLFRTGHHADGLELELARRDIPYVKYGGLKFLDRAHIKDVAAMLRVLDNPADELAWARVLRLPEGIGPAWSRRIAAAIGIGSWRAGDDSATSPLARFIDAPVNAPPAAQPVLESLARAWRASIGEELAQPPVAEQLRQVGEVARLAWPLRYPDASARLADLDRLSALTSGSALRSRFLADLTLEPPAAIGDLAGPPHLDDDWLTLSTIHSAKGLEWRAVHVIHAADGNLPSDMALRDKEGIDEERRLAYVAVSRAKDELTVSVPLRFHRRRYGLDDDFHHGQMSRFLTPLRDRFDEAAAGGPDDEPEQQVTAAAVDALLDDLWDA